jgi:pre-rRNA-processing protein IPI1
MPKSRKKKNSQKDFQKVKLKVGKKLKKADNVTNASFQTRTIFFFTKQIIIIVNLGNNC